MGAIPGHRLIVFIHENKTTDFNLPAVAAWGAVVANRGTLPETLPDLYQLHDRNAGSATPWATYPALWHRIKLHPRKNVRPQRPNTDD
ncbi:hypothetical protein [Paeniglutamicibacter kerguelensis]|uniref:Uncharacterized protein n=1 Tax=Paeniglutamicibacter kerguelensis TaxID=254788 RepID=A0ABS4XCR7_9MICC|nr:hypothetical protein [Paeniglutamicibacter kerguelensis]MBP2386269.1 hypothetical protein [Paeniglutamicibacter kerguelensis]